MTWVPLWFLLALVQSQSTVPSPPPPPNLEAGAFADGVYRNAGIGLVYQFPIGFKRVKEINESSTVERGVGEKKGPPRTGVRTWSSTLGETDSVYPIRPVVRPILFPDRLQILVFNDRYYTDLADAEAYMQDWKYLLKRMNYQVVGDIAERSFGGHRFYQLEYVEHFYDEHEVRFATVWRGYLVTFIFTTKDSALVHKERMESLICSMNSVQLTDPSSAEPMSSPLLTDGSSDPLK